MLQNLCLNCFTEKDSALACPNCGFDGNITSEHNDLQLGSVLNGKYLVGRVLGRGGFGITYLGYDINLKIKVAIKEYFPTSIVTRLSGSTQVVIHTNNSTNKYQAGLDKFLEEARVVAMFSQNPNIVTIREFFPENKTAYMVMDYIEGKDLINYVRDKNRPLYFLEAIELLNPIMTALMQVHQAGLLHRDLSPDNIYITNDEVAILLDFGAARQFSAKTQSMSVILKYAYSPIEQHQRKGKSGPYTDLYAFAATFYHMIIGKKPPESLDRLSDDELKPPSYFGIDIPKASETALLKALAVDAKDRYQTIKEFYDAINAPVERMKEQERLRLVKEQQEAKRKQDKYDLARGYILKDEYKSALKVLSTLGDFKDSIQLIVRCKQGIENKKREELELKQKEKEAKIAEKQRIIKERQLAKEKQRTEKLALHKKKLEEKKELEKRVLAEKEEQKKREEAQKAEILRQKEQARLKALKEKEEKRKQEQALKAEAERKSEAEKVEVKRRKDEEKLLALKEKERKQRLAQEKKAEQKTQAENEKKAQQKKSDEAKLIALKDEAKKKENKLKNKNEEKRSKAASDVKTEQRETQTKKTAQTTKLASKANKTKALFRWKKASIIAASVVLVAGLAYGAFVMFYSKVDENQEVEPTANEVVTDDATAKNDQEFEEKQPAEQQISVFDPSRAKTMAGAIIGNKFKFAAIRQDGKVIYSDGDIADGMPEVVSIVGPCRATMFGLTKDGRVFNKGGHWFEGWTDVAAIECNYNDTIVGIKTDGRVLVKSEDPDMQEELSGWQNIVDISFSQGHVLGLKKDGTVVAYGETDYGKCNVEDWKDVIDVWANNECSLGLTSTGQVLFTGNNIDFYDLNQSYGSGALAISGDKHGYIVVMDDGTIKAAGVYNHINGNPLPNWKNIVGALAIGPSVVAFKEDGTVEGVFDEDNFIVMGVNKDVDYSGFDFDFSEFSNFKDLMVHNREKEEYYREVNAEQGAYENQTTEVYGIVDDNKPSIFDPNRAQTVLVFQDAIAALSEDGKVLMKGPNIEEEYYLPGAVSIAYSDYGFLGLTKDGDVLTCNEKAEEIFSDWHDVTVLKSWPYFATCGVTSDGRVLIFKAEGTNSTNSTNIEEIRQWEHIIDIDYCKSNTVGLRKDGTVVGAGITESETMKLSRLKNMIDIKASGYDMAFGLTSFAEVKNNYYLNTPKQFGDGSVSVSGKHYNFVVLKNDGTVKSYRYYYNMFGEQLSELNDVVDVIAFGPGLIMLKGDGTLVGFEDKEYFWDHPNLFENKRWLFSLSILSEFENIMVHEREEQILEEIVEE